MGPDLLRAGIVQTCTGIDPAENADRVAASIARLANEGATIIFTPEMTNILDRKTDRLQANVRAEADDRTLAAARTAAQVAGVFVALGSLAIRRDDGRIANRSFLLAPDGSVHARYDKMHLFDVNLPSGERFCESATFAAGDSPVLARAGHALVGLSICYDLRFPALYAALAHAGAQLIAVPAAFTVPTGEAHWHVLLRARAIETGAFVIAAAQSGGHADGRDTFGHSLVVDPWGRVRADLGTGPCETLVELDLAHVAETRSRVPNLRHARPIPPISAPAA